MHGKGSLLTKMVGDDWQRRANLRLLLAYMFAQPGKKLLFMGVELGQWTEWNHDRSLDWHLEHDHAGLARCLAHLNRTYRGEPALHALDARPEGFAWVDGSDADHGVISFERRSEDARGRVLCVFNFTPVPRENYRLGVDVEGAWREIVNTDAAEYGGSSQGNLGEVSATIVPAHARPLSLVVTLPPLGALYLKPLGTSA